MASLVGHFFCAFGGVDKEASGSNTSAAQTQSNNCVSRALSHIYPPRPLRKQLKKNIKSASVLEL